MQLKAKILFRMQKYCPRFLNTNQEESCRESKTTAICLSKVSREYLPHGSVSAALEAFLQIKRRISLTFLSKLEILMCKAHRDHPF
jgi:hypothetical protein